MMDICDYWIVISACLKRIGFIRTRNTASLRPHRVWDEGYYALSRQYVTLKRCLAQQSSLALQYLLAIYLHYMPEKPTRI